MMHIRLSQGTLEPVQGVGREIPLLLALAELLEQHDRAQLPAVLWPGRVHCPPEPCRSRWRVGSCRHPSPRLP